MNDNYIYLVFSKTGTWLSRLITIISKIKYVHSSISFDKSFTTMYSFGRLHPNNPFLGGFVEENLHEGVYKKFIASECLIYKVKVSEIEFNSMKKEVNRFLEEKYKYKYNFIGLFAILANIPIKRKTHYFCSEFVSEILINCNLYESNKTPSLIKTNDLLEIRNKEIIYEGYINNYYTSNELFTLEENF